MKHETRRRLRMRMMLRRKATSGITIRQVGDMPPSTHSKSMKPARKRSRRGGAAFRRGQKGRS